jgi:hypothetical protein
MKKLSGMIFYVLVFAVIFTGCDNLEQPDDNSEGITTGPPIYGYLKIYNDDATSYYDYMLSDIVVRQGGQEVLRQNINLVKGSNITKKVPAGNINITSTSSEFWHSGSLDIDLAEDETIEIAWTRNGGFSFK